MTAPCRNPKLCSAVTTPARTSRPSWTATRFPSGSKSPSSGPSKGVTIPKKDGLLALHARTAKGPWVVLHETHQYTKIVQEGRGVFGLIAEGSTAPADYGRANAAFTASHRLLPELAAELIEARRLLAAR